MRRTILAVVAAALLLFGCTSGDSSSSDTTSGGDTTATTTAQTFPPGPAPGVTDTSVKVGVAYVDLASLAGIVDIDHGDYEAAYNALFDSINADGGINGRTIEPIFAPIAPTGNEPADAACTKLTEDDDVFLIMGFFLGDNVLCPVATHSTAVIGGVITGDRLAQADAPWYSNEGSEDLQAEAVRSMAEAGDLDGTVGVFGGPEEEALMNDVILPLLDELGVDVAESAIVDQSADTPPAPTTPPRSSGSGSRPRASTRSSCSARRASPTPGACPPPTTAPPCASPSRVPSTPTWARRAPT